MYNVEHQLDRESEDWTTQVDLCNIHLQSLIENGHSYHIVNLNIPRSNFNIHTKNYNASESNGDLV